MGRSKVETPALVALGILSMATNVMVPILVDTLIENLGLDRVGAGRITSFEFLGALAGSVVVLALVRRISRRRMAYLGTAIWIACSALSALYPTEQALTFLRAGSGFGMGTTLAITMGAIASRPNPVRLFAGLMVGVPLFLLFAIPALQMTVQQLGVRGAYGFLGAMATLGLLLASQLPSAASHADGAEDHAATRPSLLSPPVLFLVAGCLILFIGFNGAWAYVSQVGRGIGIPAQTVAWTIGIAQLASIAGSFLAGVLNERLGHAGPLIFATGLTIVGSVLLSRAADQTLFSISLVPLLFGWLMSQPFIMGVAATQDRTGTVATGVNVAQNMGTAAGPYLAARVIEGQPVSLIGYFAATVFAVGLMLLLPAALRRKLRAVDEV